MHTRGAGGSVILLVEGDVVVAGYDDFEFGIGFADHVECGFVFVDVPDVGEVAGVEEHVG